MADFSLKHYELRTTDEYRAASRATCIDRILARSPCQIGTVLLNPRIVRDLADAAASHEGDLELRHYVK